jgi:signal transduction histidine kinase/DNA-binding NarL/FixJ family response regulator
MKNLFFAIVFLLVLSCEDKAGKGNELQMYESFRDVPGITSEEITAIEALQKTHSSFKYAMTLSTETFVKENGEIGGYSALFCEWLSNLFGIQFKPEIYELNNIFNGLESKEIDFTGDITISDERRKNHFMTSTISERSLKVFKIKGTPAIAEIAKSRLPRLVFTHGFTPLDDIKKVADYAFEPVFVNNHDEAHSIIKSGEADAYLTMNIAEIAFDAYDDVVSETFYPLVFASAALFTQNSDLNPIISVVQKALENGSASYLASLYALGQHNYIKNKFLEHLTPEEREYIKHNPIVKVATESDSYPISFYNYNDNELQGIAIDIMKELKLVTGLSFEIANPLNTSYLVLTDMVESGEASMITAVMRSKERERSFLMPGTAIMKEYPLLISKNEFPNAQFNELSNIKVGMVRGTIYSKLFKRWFPNNNVFKEYGNMDSAFNALMHGEVDMFMCMSNYLLSITNYKELLGYKANVVFDNNFDITFGINKDKDVLYSILNKALGLIDMETISRYWTRKTYDYRAKIAEARLPWLVGATILSLIIFALILVMFYRSSNEGKRLAKLEVMESEAANRAKSSFLATMSHEIRTPMNAILGITEIQLQNGNLSADLKNALNIIYNSGYTLLGIINDLLDLSKIEAGKLELINGRYETASMINDTIHINAARIGSKPIELKLQVSENLPYELIGDELRVKQILNNLLSNAIKYTESGEVSLSFSAIEDNENSSDVDFVITVKDTGQGMNKEQVQTIFDAYSRFNMKANRLVEGTGLGMNIVHNLVKKMGGKIFVSSEPGVGTEITAHLIQGYSGPARLGKELAKNLMAFRSHGMSKIKKAQIVREYMPHGRVLVVDDMETNLYVAKGFLLPYGLEIDTALSGKKAIAKIESGNTYDIVFMDHMMPEMDGIETVKLLRSKGYTSPIIALTANAVAGQADMFMANGFDGFISKPIDIRELDASLNKYVRSKLQAEASKVLNMDPELTELFIRDAEKAAAVLKGYKSYESDNLKMYIINIHALKSMLANVGETALSALARDLEQAGNDKNISFISKETPSFLDDLQKVVEKLKL